MLSALALLARGAAAAGTASPSDADAARADKAVGEALSRGADPVTQARNLCELAWPNGTRDEVIAARARRELADFGGHGMVALRDALNEAKADLSAIQAEAKK